MPLAHDVMRPSDVHFALEHAMSANRGLTPADYARALAEAGGCASGAARILGVGPSAVSQMARRHGLRVLPRGRPRRDVVCWVSDVVRIGDREFRALHVDVGTKHLAELLDVSKPAVSRRLRRMRDAGDE